MRPPCAPSAQVAAAQAQLHRALAAAWHQLQPPALQSGALHLPTAAALQSLQQQGSTSTAVPLQLAGQSRQALCHLELCQTRLSAPQRSKQQPAGGSWAAGIPSARQTCHLTELKGFVPPCPWRVCLCIAFWPSLYGGVLP